MSSTNFCVLLTKDFQEYKTVVFETQIYTRARHVNHIQLLFQLKVAVLYQINVALKQRYISIVYKLLQQTVEVTSLNFLSFFQGSTEEEGQKPN